MRKLTLLILLPVLVTACGGGSSGGSAEGEAPEEASRIRGPTAPRAGDRPDQTRPRSRGEHVPSIRIIRPAEGESVRGGNVAVSVRVESFDIVNQRVRPPFPRPVAGKGHIHFYLDTQTLPTTHAPPATGTYRSVSTTSYTWSGIPPGRHTLAVQLVGKDHVPLEDPAKDRISITSVR